MAIVEVFIKERNTTSRMHRTRALLDSSSTRRPGTHGSHRWEGHNPRNITTAGVNTCISSQTTVLETLAEGASPLLHQIAGRLEPRKYLKKGDLVTIANETASRNQWSLGRVGHVQPQYQRDCPSS